MSTPHLEFKSAVTGVKVLDEGEGIVQAIVSVTEIVDAVNDRILPGAYAKTLAKRTPKGLRGHDWHRMVAKTLHAEELRPGDRRIGDISEKIADLGGGGLLVRGQYNLNTQLGKDAYEDAKFFGEEMEWSVGYKVPKGMSSIVHKTGTREIKEMDLYEWSDVAFGAAPLTAGTTSVKSAITAMVEEGVLTSDEIMEWAELAGIKNLEAVEEAFEQAIEEKNDEGRTLLCDLDDLETKLKRVATAAGVRRYRQPIRTPIRSRRPLTTRIASGVGSGRAPARALGPNVKGVHYFKSGSKTTIHEYHELDPAPIREEIRRAGGLKKWLTEDLNYAASILVMGLLGGVRPNTDMKAANSGLTDEDFAEAMGIVLTELGHVLAESPDLSDDDLEMVFNRCAAALVDGPGGGGRGGAKSVMDVLDEAMALSADVEGKVRKVRTPEGARKYGAPIGTPITADMIPAKPKRGKKKPSPADVPQGRIGTGKRAGRIRADAAKERDRWKKPPLETVRTAQGAAKTKTPIGDDAPGRESREVHPKGFGADLTPDERTAVNQLNPDYPGLTAGDDAEVLETDNIEEALEALHNDKRVKLSQPRQVSTLLDRMVEIVNDAKAKDKTARKRWEESGRDPELYDKAVKAKRDPDARRAWLDAGHDEGDIDLAEEIPDYNLCNITVEGSNLFCTDHKGYTRLTMPQLAGKPRKGSRAEALLNDQNERARQDWIKQGKDGKAFVPEVEVNLADLYRTQMASIGVGTTQRREKASTLKATQQELVGANVASMMQSMQNTNPDGSAKDPAKRTMPPGRIFVSRDNYVLDGHHRWAAVIGMDLVDNHEGDLDMDVEVVDMDILELLAQTIKWTVEMGVEPKGGGKGSGAASVAAQEAKKTMQPNVETKDGDIGGIGDLGPEAELAAQLSDADPDHLGALSDDQWGQLLDILHGEDLAAVKSINDRVLTGDVDNLALGDLRSRHVLLWHDRLDAKVGLSDTELELLIDGLESKAASHRSSTHPGLDRSPKENWVDKAGGLPSYIERIAKHLHSDRGMTISHAIAAAINRVKKWAAGTGDVKPDTRAKAAKAVAQWEKMKAKTKTKSILIDGEAMETKVKKHRFMGKGGTCGICKLSMDKGAHIGADEPDKESPGAAEERDDDEDEGGKKKKKWTPPWEKALDDLTDVDVASMLATIGEYQAKRSVPNPGAAPPGDMGDAAGPDPNEGGHMAEGMTAPGTEPEGTGDKDQGTDTSQGESAAQEGTGDDSEEDGEGEDEGKEYLIHYDTLTVLADLQEKAGRVLSTNNAEAIRGALTQLVQVLNRAGIAWGEAEGEPATATKGAVGWEEEEKGARRGNSGYPWGERSNTLVETDDDDEDEDEEDEGGGQKASVRAAAPPDSGVSDEEADEEEGTGTAEDADENDTQDDEDDEDDEEEGKALVFLPLSDLMEAASLRLSSSL